MARYGLRGSLHHDDEPGERLGDRGLYDLLDPYRFLLCREGGLGEMEKALPD